MSQGKRDRQFDQLIRRALRPTAHDAFMSDLFLRQRYAINKAFELDLTENQRKLCVMYYCRGRTMPDIADEFDCAVSTVSRGLKRVGERFERAMRGCV